MATKDLSKLWGENEKIKTRIWLFYVGKNPIKRFFYEVYDNGIKVINANGEKLEDAVAFLAEAYIDGDLIYWERTYCPKCDVQFFSDDDDEPEGITIQQWNMRTRKPKAWRK